MLMSLTAIHFLNTCLSLMTKIQCLLAIKNKTETWSYWFFISLKCLSLLTWSEKIDCCLDASSPENLGFLSVFSRWKYFSKHNLLSYKCVCANTCKKCTHSTSTVVLVQIINNLFCTQLWNHLEMLQNFLRNSGSFKLRDSFWNCLHIQLFPIAVNKIFVLMNVSVRILLIL